ncbi:MAG: ComF family protein, partial [Thermodesulfobacteriota bacterium]
NTRSEVGELLYRLKYKNDKSVIKELAQTVGDYIKKRNWEIDVVVPVPPSRKGRDSQPVVLVAKELGYYLGIPVCNDCLVKTKETTESKNIDSYSERKALLKDAYKVLNSDLLGGNVLLIDDLFGSGATLNSTVTALRESEKVGKIYAVTLTKTGTRR